MTHAPAQAADRAPGSGPVIEMRDVTLGSMRDLELEVAEQVNWTVLPGELWVVLGMQGTGKSDLLMLTAGLMSPLSGEYLFFGERMSILSEPRRVRERLRLGLVFENGRLFNQLTVRENIALPFRYHRNLTAADADSEVRRMLDALELGPFADATPGSLGRNWQKRVGLGRALVLKPEVVLLDNPLGGLDLRHRHWWLTAIRELHRGHPLLEGKPVTLVITAADLRPWSHLADRFAVLREKRFFDLGTRERLETEHRELAREFLDVEQVYTPSE